MTGTDPSVEVRNTRREDLEQIVEMCREVYPGISPWKVEQLEQHLAAFPEGQFVAIQDGKRVVGFAASLIILWDDYEMTDSWRDFTGGGTFSNHDPAHGRTLYGAEVMVRPGMQGHGVGKKLYAARRELTRRLGLRRIRAGARLRNYHRYAGKMSAEEYVRHVTDGKDPLSDPTLSFQLKQGFHVIAVVAGYMPSDAESLGYAAIIEWLNPDKTSAAEDKGDPRFRGAGARSDETAHD